MSDIINHPKHYVDSALVLEPMMLSEHFSSRDGQIIQYIMRAGKKLEATDSNAAEAEVRDLQKALFWLNRRLAAPVKIERHYDAEVGVMLELIAHYSDGLLKDTEYEYKYGGTFNIDGYFSRLQVRVAGRINDLMPECYNDVKF